MIAKKCDRCGKYYEIYNVRHSADKTNGVMFVNIDERGQYFSNTAIDLCSECMEAIRNFVQGVGDNG